VIGWRGPRPYKRVGFTAGEDRRLRDNRGVDLLLDRPRFESLCAAFEYVLREHAARKHPAYPDREPAFIFRGECGRFPTTMPSIARVRGLSAADVLTLAKISDWVAALLHQEREDLTWPQAGACLQHYGMPSRIVDFTGDLASAFAFAGDGDSDVGRLGVLPYVPSETGPMIRLFDHPWAERAQRQAAFGVLMDPSEISDLKADPVRSRLGMRWYEFAILPQERNWCRQHTSGLRQESSDPSGGFVRHYITRYVEEFGKLSPPLTDWLLSHIVIAPYCALVDRLEEEEAVVFFRGAESLAEHSLPPFDRELEIERSRRYWSADCEDDSRRRLDGFVWPPSGQMFVDPRTYHPNVGTACSESQRPRASASPPQAG